MSTENRFTEAENIVKNHVLISMGAGLVPIPLLDIAAVTAVQMDMLKQLAWLYKIDYPSNFDRSLITALTGSVFARIGASFIKAIPVVGSIIGGMSMAVMSGASTYAVGRVFVRHFETGGDFFNFDPMTARRVFEEEYERGRQAAEQWKQEKDSPTTAGGATKTSGPSDEVIAKLRQLDELRQSGVLNEEEFQRLKGKLLEEF